MLEQIVTSELKQIFTTLSPHECRLVGGVVRDYILGKVASDIDIATTASPSLVQQMLTQAKIKNIPTGIEHGTITAVINKKVFEITTLRKDIKTFGRHAKVKFTNNFKEDSSRRDFTFNAMYMEINGNITDFWNGVADLKAGRVQFISNPSDRIKEDYLRILRYFRFYARYGKIYPPPELIKTLSNNSKFLKNLSAERITTEILSLLKASNPAPAWELLEKCAVHQAINLPSGNIKALSKIDTNCPLVKLIALFEYKTLNIFDNQFFMFSKAQKKILKNITVTFKQITINENLQKQIYICGDKNIFIKALKVKIVTSKKEDANSFKTLLKQAENSKIPAFPLRGADLIKRGITPSIEMGNLLKKIETWWLNNNFPSRTDCISQIEKLK